MNNFEPRQRQLNNHTKYSPPIEWHDHAHECHECAKLPTIDQNIRIQGFFNTRGSVHQPQQRLEAVDHICTSRQRLSSGKRVRRVAERCREADRPRNIDTHVSHLSSLMSWVVPIHPRCLVERGVPRSLAKHSLTITTTHIVESIRPISWLRQYVQWHRSTTVFQETQSDRTRPYMKAVS